MRKTTIKKTAITKVLSCFLVFVILMSAVPVSVLAVNDSNNATDASANRTLLDGNNISFVSKRTGNTDIFVMGRISKLNNEPPSPKITAVEIDPPTCVKEGESATITVKFKNFGGPSSIGYISVSFPHDETIMDVSGTGDKEDIYPKGSDKLWGKHGKIESSKYPLAELTEFQWDGGQEKNLIITVKPNSGSDKIVFCVRAALKNDADGSYERDPTSSDYSDQQEWYVYRYSMDTCNVYPNLIITDIDPDENDRKIYYKIKNIGGITAGPSYSYLYIDNINKRIASDYVYSLQKDEERRSYFDLYTCYGDSDAIKVCADGKGKISEADETDNCKTITKECDSYPESLIVDILNPENEFSVVQGVSEIVKAKATDNFGSSVSGLTVKATFTNGDAELILYDDGAHSDGAANNGIYANVWVPTTVAVGHTETACTIKVTAYHTTLSSGYDEVKGVINSPKRIMIELTPPSHDFGEEQTTLSTAPFSFTLKNVGGGTATGEVYLTGNGKDQFIITSGKGSFSLDADQTKTIGVAFSPTSAGSKSATLYAKGSNCNDDQSSLSGTGEKVGQPPLEPHINIENVLINYDSNDPRNIIGPLKIVAEEKTTIEVILNNTGSQNFNGGDAWLHWETEDTDTSPITPVKEGSAPAIYIKKIPPIPIGSSVTIQFEDTFRVPSTPDQLNVYLNFYSEVDEYKTNTFNKRPIFIWPSGSDYISCTLGVFNVASGGIVKACKDAGMMVSSINYVLFVADVNKLIEKAKAREFDREYWHVISKCIISIGAAAKIAGAQILSIILGSLEAAIPCANILNIFIEINQAIHTALYEVGLDVLTVIVGSPANVCIIDDNGNICGIFEDGTIIDQIPGSYISQFDHFKIVSVPGDGSKDEIKIEGTDNGEANVTLFKPKEMSATGVMISYDKVPVSPTTKIRIDMNPTSNPTYAMKIDNDGDGTTDETKEPDSIENIIADFPKLCTSPDPPSTNFGTVPEDQARTRDFFITNSGSGTLTWTISSDQPSWININPTSGSATTEADVVTVTIDTHDLTPGPHTGQITITSNGGEKTGTITVNVPPPALEPKLCTSPDPPTTNFGTVPEDQTRTWDFFITNCGSGTLTWTISCDQPSWLNVNPASGSTTALDVVTVTIDTHDLSPGTHTGHITLTSNGGDKTGTITVNVPEQIRPNLCTSPDPPSHDFGTVAKDQTRTWDFDVRNCGSGTLTWSVSDDKNWMSVYPTSGSTTTERDTVTVRIDTQGLSPGTHTGHITLTSNGGDKAGTITVVVPKPKPQNQPPENPTLTPDRSSPQLAGTTIKWTASATDPDGDPLYYQFRLKGPATGNSWQIKRDWSTTRTWTWYTTASDAGESDVSVRIRDGHHASKSSYDLTKTVYDYKITADKKRPTATIDSITPNPATQGDDTVRFKGHGYDSDGYIVDYYWKSSKDGKLSSSKEFTKSASNLDVGTHTISFKVKDDDGLWSDWATMTLKIEEKKEDSKYVEFRGVVTWKSSMPIGGVSWVVNVDEWISGSISCDEIKVVWGSGVSSGSFDPDISTGDRVEAYGKVNPWGNDKCEVGLNDESHYIKKV